MIVKTLYNLSNDEQEKLEKFLESNEEQITPYHFIDYNQYIDFTFKYKNFSLVALEKGEIVGYLPQWKHGKKIESIPWRDKGGPIAINNKVIDVFIQMTRDYIKENSLIGFIWKDFKYKNLKNYSYFINIDLRLGDQTEDSYWNILKHKRIINQAIRNNVSVRLEENNDSTINSFYNFFFETRKKKGVPVYPIKIFKNLLIFLKKKILIFSANVNNNHIAFIILFLTKNKAIYAYGASSEIAYSLRANDLLMWNAINYCIRIKIKNFDFGADSPLQESLIRYKLKWSGIQRKITSSFDGKVKERDHNKKYFKPINFLISKLPEKFYNHISNMIIK